MHEAFALSLRPAKSSDALKEPADGDGAQPADRREPCSFPCPVSLLICNPPGDRGQEGRRLRTPPLQQFLENELLEKSVEIHLEQTEIAP